MTYYVSLLAVVVVAVPQMYECFVCRDIGAESDANKLYDDKLKRNGYNKLIRPVGNTTDTLTVHIGLRLTQIIDVIKHDYVAYEVCQIPMNKRSFACLEIFCIVLDCMSVTPVCMASAREGKDEKNQIMTTNVWLEQQWYDFRLTWHPEEYGGVRTLYVPSSHIWLPDIVLYNSADGNFTVKLMTKATIRYDGLVIWKPPAIYKSLCPINVEFFPFDEQLCTLKIGSWSYDGFSVDIKHISLPRNANELDVIEKGIDLYDYYKSTEWDLLAVPAKKYEKFYTCCSEPYPDIKFNITIRRKTLFYTVNLILPCVAICSVTLLVFYIPANSGEKITMGITILNSLNIFLLLVAEINPPTSLATPLIGKYLLFTMVLVTCSIIVTVFVLNIHFRSPSTHIMAPWVQELFLRVLPRLLFMERPHDKLTRSNKYPKVAVRTGEGVEIRDSYLERRITAVRQSSLINSATDNVRTKPAHKAQWSNAPDYVVGNDTAAEPEIMLTSSSSASQPRQSTLPPIVMQAVIGVNFIADHLKQQDEFNRVKQDWQFVAMVLDRMFLWMFTAACLVGTFGIIIQAPTLYDSRVHMATGPGS